MTFKSRELRKRYVILAVICLTFLVSALDRAYVSVALPYIREDLGLSAAQAGFASSAFFLAYACSQLAGGILAEGKHSKLFMVIAFLWWSLFTAMTGLTTGFIGLLIVRFVFGLGEGIHPPIAWKILTRWFPRAQRGVTHTTTRAFITVGPAVGALVGGIVIAQLGWRPGFLILGVVGAVLAVTVCAKIKTDPFEDPTVSDEELSELVESEEEYLLDVESPTYRSILAAPNVIKLALSQFFHGAAFWGFSSWLPSYLVLTLGFSMTETAWVTAAPYLVGSIGYVLGGYLSDKYFANRRKYPAAVCEILAGLCMLGVVCARDDTMAIVFIILTGGMLLLAAGFVFSIPPTSLPDYALGRGMGFINFVTQLGSFAAPTVIGLILTATGENYSIAFMSIVAAQIITGLLVLSLKKVNGAQFAR